MEGIDSRFGLEMKRLREAKGISQRKLGEMVGLDSGYISRIERGLFKPPSEEKIVAIAKALDANPDFFLSLSGKVSSDVMDAVTKQPEKMSEVVRSSENLGDWLGVALVVILAIALFSNMNNKPSKSKKEWSELMKELRRETEHLPREQQMQVINHIRLLMNNWESDLIGY